MAPCRCKELPRPIFIGVWKNLHRAIGVAVFGGIFVFSPQKLLSYKSLLKFSVEKKGGFWPAGVGMGLEAGQAGASLGKCRFSQHGLHLCLITVQLLVAKLSQQSAEFSNLHVLIWVFPVRNSSLTKGLVRA